MKYVVPPYNPYDRIAPPARRLPPNERRPRVLALRDLMGARISEIAAAFGVTPSTVQSDLAWMRRGSA